MTSRIGFAKLRVQDLDAMATFFLKALDGKEKTRLSLPTMDEVIIGLSQDDDPELVLTKIHAGGETVPPYCTFCFFVESCDDAVAACLEAGGSIFREPATYEDIGIRMAYLNSPEGHTYEVLQKLR